MKSWTTACVLALGVLPGCANTGEKSTDSSAPPAATASRTDSVDEGQLRTFIELARKDLRSEKAKVLAENVQLTDAESRGFWPMYRQYEAEMIAINDKRIAVLEKFIPRASAMSDDEARRLGKVTLELDQQRLDLKRKYFEKFQRVLPPAKAARVMQIENQLNMLVDLHIAATMPLIK